MLPKVIVHSLVSLDGHIDGFDAEIGMYYGIAGRFGADIVLFGSRTIELASVEARPEVEADFRKPATAPDDRRSLWAVPDSRGRLRNLHAFRGTEYCRDIVVLVSETTPKAYLDYLGDREYDHIVAGRDRVDLRRALELLHERYGCQVVRTDSGGELNSALLQQGLVDELSLVIAPVLAGSGGTNLFRTLGVGPDGGAIGLELVSCEMTAKGHLHVLYRVLR